MIGPYLCSALLLFTFVVSTLGDHPYYVVIPKFGNDPKTNGEINTYINDKVKAPDKVFWCNSDNVEIGTLYWWAPLDDKTKTDLQNDKGKNVGLTVSHIMNRLLTKVLAIS